MGSFSLSSQRKSRRSFGRQKSVQESEWQILFLPLLLFHLWSQAALASQGALQSATSVHLSPQPFRSSMQPSIWASGTSNVGSRPFSSSTHGVSEQLMDPALTPTSLEL